MDMLFFNYITKCFVVLEIKASDFESPNTGQLGTYVVAVNHQMKEEWMNVIVLFNIIQILFVCILAILLIICVCLVIDSVKDILTTISPDRNNGWLTKPLKQLKCGAIYGHDWQTISTICTCTRCGKVKKFHRK